ncbi:MAG: STAS domain-containing protein [Actinomycetota bacterium]|jgi:anti-sigma B factor antagonist|nr:STAS domain-containing protein [Actinomycetota bacterium]MDA8280613.1 STAS domain-containing protein [Actinomycetota bacterium]
MEVRFDVTARDNIPVLAAAGEIDVYTAPRLREQLLQLAHAGHATVVVDLTEVSFIDSTGLGVLVSGLKRFREAGGDLRLVVTQPQILKVLEITGLSSVFAVHDTAAAATADQPA